MGEAGPERWHDQLGCLAGGEIADGEEGGVQYADVLLLTQGGRWIRAETGAAQPMVAI